MDAPVDKSNYLILLHQPNGSPPPAEQLQKIMARFEQWMNGLRTKGMVVGTNGLDTSGKVLRGPRGALMTDGPYTEGKEVMGGYILLSASSLDEAVKAARECPGLDHNMAVEVRPIRNCSAGAHAQG